MAFIVYFLMFNYMIFGVQQVTLAMVEEGYVDSKDQESFGWVASREVNDPSIPTEIDELKKESLTMPEAIKKYHMRKNLVEDDRKALSLLLDKEPKLIE